MKKLNLINDIEYIIKMYGAFNTSEVFAESSPSIEVNGNLTHLVERFNQNNVEVIVYGNNDNELDTYNLAYGELSYKVLKEIRDLAIIWQEQQKEELS